MEGGGGVNCGFFGFEKENLWARIKVRYCEVGIYTYLSSGNDFECLYCM